MKSVCSSFHLLQFLLLFAVQLLAQDSLLTSRHYQTLTEDGAWCWFSDPRSVYLEGIQKQIITGWVSKEGNIVVASMNSETGKTFQKVLHSNFNRDDHANPSFLILPDKRLMIFYSSHSVPGNKIIHLTTRNPEDITEWEDAKDITTNTIGKSSFCYTNPVMLSAENNRVYLFWRGGNYKPTFSFTDDFGKTWSNAQTLVQSENIDLIRPYMKVASNGIDEIHFAFTDGHPRNEPLNSIYYMKYKKGKFFKADGTQIGDASHLPIKHEITDVVFNAQHNFTATGNGVRAWIWDVAFENNGNPVLVYSLLPEETLHRYFYARFNGKSWDNYFISNAGKSFPRLNLTKEQRDPEPHYSGGIYLDHQNPANVYLSKPVKDVFEIFKYSTSDFGKSWSGTQLTHNSLKNNVRPYVVRFAPESISPRVLWMHGDYEHYTNFSTGIKTDKQNLKPSNKFTQADVRNVMKSVADWQLQEPLHYDLTDWTNGALFAGMVEWAKISGEEKYFNWLIDIGNKARWRLGNRTYHADDHCVAQMYIELFRKYGDNKMINPLKSHFDWIIGNPSKISLKFQSDSVTRCTDRWSWCDAIFMGPTVWTKLASITGKKKYLDFMESEFRFTTEYLYDKDEHLYFRDDTFFEQKEANGKKVFWGRGNGWVVAGLATILKELPKNYPSRSYFENIYKQMCEKLLTLQDSKGYWHASLLDPDSYPTPETSASSFYIYAMAWGINYGHLDSGKYLPAVIKGWQAIVDCAHPDGKLGWVQPIGASPKKVTYDMTEVYGVGAFLLAGTEVIKLVK
ncbi:MAG: glycoside hydrolase family 88 protein [Melioribacteraceae bacterium]